VPVGVEQVESMMSGGEYAVASGDVLSLAASTACSAYDAEFVVLARELGVPLITTDKLLLESFPDTAVSPARFLGDYDRSPYFLLAREVRFRQFPALLSVSAGF